MIRNVLGSLLALIGAAAAVFSPFRPWYDGRQGSDYRIADLFNGISASGSGVFTSLLLPFLFAALVTLIGLVLRSRSLVGLAGLVVLGFTFLWMVRQGQAADALSVGGGTGLGIGVVYAVGGGLVLLLASLVMSGRRRARRQGWEPSYEPQYQPEPPDPYAPRAPYEPEQRYEQYGYQPQQYDPRPPRPAPPEDWAYHDGDTQSLPRITNEPWSASSTPPGGPPERPPEGPSGPPEGPPDDSRRG